MKYIRTKDGRIVDIEKFINEEKDTPYYKDFEFEEIKNKEDYCYIHWTAIGTKENSQKDQVGRRCQFGATIDSPFIKQSDNIEDLFDAYVCIVKNYDPEYCTCLIRLKASWKSCTEKERKLRKIYGSIWTNKGLIYVAKINDKGEWELI